MPVVGSILGRRIVASATPPGPDVGQKFDVPQLSAADLESAYLPPIGFYAEAMVAAGQTVSLRSAALSNATRRPVEIREIRLGAYSPPGAAKNTGVDLGGVLKVSLSVDGHLVTSGLVPAWLLGKTEDWRAQGYRDSVVTGVLWSQYVWRFAKPWYMPPGAQVSAQLHHSGEVVDSIVGQIGLFGSVASPRRTSFIPYAAAWASQAYQAADTAIEESNENDLSNATSNPVDVDRLIARVGTRESSSAYPGIFYGDRPTDGGFTIKAATSHGEVITPGYVGVRAGFGSSRALEMSHQIAPGDYFKVTARKVAVTAYGTNSFLTRVFAGIVGSREVTL